MNIRETITTFRADVAAYVDMLAASEDVDPAVLLKLDEVATKLNGVLNFLSEVENGTRKYPAAMLRQELFEHHADALGYFVEYVAAAGCDVANFLENYQDEVDGIELPPLDRTTTDSIPRMCSELARSIESTKALMTVDPKKVASGGRAVSVLARRIIKTSLVGGAYVPRQQYITLYSNALARAAFVELRKLDDYLDRAEELFEEFTRQADECESQDAERIESFSSL